MKFLPFVVTLNLFSVLGFTQAGVDFPVDALQVFQNFVIPPGGCAELLKQRGLRTCSSIVEDVCSKLWSPENRGNISNGDSTFLLGKGPKNVLSNASLANIDALINSNLPDNLKKLEPLLTELKVVVDKRSDTKKWYREYGLILTKLNNKIDDIVDKEAFKIRPELESKLLSNYKVEDNELITKKSMEIRDQLLEAKYKNHPNWKRVEKIYPEVKKDMLKLVDEFELPKSLKAKYLDKINDLELTLPYIDPKKANSSISCGSEEINAYYMPALNKFTMCAGFFNTQISEDSIYRVMAHELAHSIDPQNFLNDLFLESPLHQYISTLSTENEPSCAEWNYRMNGFFSQIPYESFQYHPLVNFNDCLLGRDDLRPMNQNIKSEIINNYTKSLISNSASMSHFTVLAQHKTQDDNGNVIDNELYLNPRLYEYRSNGYNESSNMDPFRVGHVFTKNLKCITPKEYSELEGEDRKRVFQQAIQATLNMMSLLSDNFINFCGKECSHLTGFGVSKSSGENFSDWIATKLLEKKIKEEKNKEGKVQMIQDVVTFHCSRPGIASLAEDLLEIEKLYSLTPHGAEKSRRLSNFTPEIRKQVGCFQNEVVLGDTSQCVIK